MGRPEQYKGLINRWGPLEANLDSYPAKVALRNHVLRYSNLHGL